MTRYVPSPAGSFGCRSCVAMKELLSFVWKTDIPRFKRLWDSSECQATMAGASYLLLERGEDFSLYQIDPHQVFPELAKLLPPVWISNSSMHPIEED